MKAIKLNQFGLVIALWALAASACAASPIWVSNTNDAGNNSLRAAITKANMAGGGEIRFSVTNTITLLSPLPSLTNITITGPGTNLLTISGGNQFRVFSMNSATTNALSDLTIADGMEVTSGAGISNAGHLRMTGCVVSNCTTFGADSGVGICNAGTLEMEACLICDCYAPDQNGLHGGLGIYNSGLLSITNSTIAHCGNLFDAHKSGAGILNGGSLFMIGSIIEACDAGFEGDGGGIYNLGEATLLNCIVRDCDGYWGGGILSGGSLAMTNCSVVDNRGSERGGGIDAEGDVVLSGCTIYSNLAYAVCGGGINNGGELTLFNCTISENSLQNQSWPGGSGIASGYYPSQVPGSTVYLDHCTVVSNSGPNGIIVATNLSSKNSILADCIGTLTSAGYNLLIDTNGCTIVGDETGNIYGKDPVLGPLQDNGGPTWTHALLPGSPAIDAGSNGDPLAIDQRGIHRPQGLATDIGAFEFQYATPMLVRMAVQSCTNYCLKLCGLSGGIYTLQASTNLVNWFNVATSIADTNGVCDFTERGAGRCSPRFYRVSLPVPPGSVYIPAPSGIVDAPFLITNTFIWQLTYTGITDGGRAEYPFILPSAGDYVLQAMVNAPNNGVNSFFVNIDAEPQDPTMIWDVLPYTSACGFEQRTVNWRGNGTDTADQFVPIVFTLSQGSHKLIIRGREASTILQSMAVSPYP